MRPAATAINSPVARPAAAVTTCDTVAVVAVVTATGTGVVTVVGATLPEGTHAEERTLVPVT